MMMARLSKNSKENNVIIYRKKIFDRITGQT